MPRRIERVQELIQREASSILHETFSPKDSIVTVTRVSVAQDLSTTKVFLSIYPFDRAKQILADLERVVPQIQSELNKRLFMKHVPRLIFRVDEVEKEAAETEKALRLLDTE
ncbi:MAG: 30S ribosome-binding factor RbfA [Candidatus Spechtbacteria bacterium]|nr:30S ribosome-binding factor RbfA [Candidatus Spechtbacteria bacterium]